MFPQAPPPDSSEGGSPNSDGNLDMGFYLPLLGLSPLFGGPSEQGQCGGHAASLWLPWIAQMLGGNCVTQTDLGVEGGLCRLVLCPILRCSPALALPACSEGWLWPRGSGLV